MEQKRNSETSMAPGSRPARGAATPLRPGAPPPRPGARHYSLQGEPHRLEVGPDVDEDPVADLAAELEHLRSGRRDVDGDGPPLGVVAELCLLQGEAIAAPADG